MTVLYQIENLKSGRRVRKGRVYGVIWEWGCDCGSDGSFLTERELGHAEKQLSIRYYANNDGDCELYRFEVIPIDERITAKSKKERSRDFENDTDL